MPPPSNTGSGDNPPVPDLIRQGQHMGVVIIRGPSGRLDVRAPAHAHDLAQRILDHTPKVLRYLEDHDLTRAGVPRHDIGNCARCTRRCHRYGPHGTPLCPRCQPTTPTPDTGRPHTRAGSGSQGSRGTPGNGTHPRHAHPTHGGRPRRTASPQPSHHQTNATNHEHDEHDSNQIIREHSHEYQETDT